MSEEASWPPFTLESSGIASKGLSYDLMNLIFSKIGCKVKIELLPQARLIENAKSGKSDGITIISKNSDREKFLVYSDKPLFVRKAYLYYLADRANPIEFKGWESIKNYSLGIVAGSNYSKEFEEARKNIPLKVTIVVRSSQLFEMTMNKRIDAFPAMDLMAREFINLPQYKNKFTHTNEAYDSYPYYFAVSQKSDLIKAMPLINKTIDQLLVSGEISKVLKKYGM